MWFRSVRLVFLEDFEAFATHLLVYFIGGESQCVGSRFTGLVKVAILSIRFRESADMQPILRFVQLACTTCVFNRLLSISVSLFGASRLHEREVVVRIGVAWIELYGLMVVGYGPAIILLPTRSITTIEIGNGIVGLKLYASIEIGKSFVVILRVVPGSPRWV